MNKRERIHLEAEQVVLESLGSSWVSAKDLADQIGVDWHSVAKTLRRLARGGSISEQLEERVTAKTRIRSRFLYCRPDVPASLPLWLQPCVPSGVRVVGIRRVTQAWGMRI